MWKRVVLLACLGLATMPVAADPEAPGVIEQVLKAHEQNDGVALERLVREHSDAWLLVEDLLEREHVDAATAVAKTTGQSELAAYAKWREVNPPGSKILDALKETPKTKAESQAWVDAHRPLFEEDKSGVRFVSFLARYGEVLNQLGDVKAAVSTFERAARKATDLGWHLSAVHTFGYAAVAMRDAKQYAAAARLLAERTQAAAASGLHEVHYQALRDAAHESKRIGRLPDAREYIRKAQKIAKTPTETRLALRDRVEMEIRLGRTRTAIELLPRLKQLEEEAGDALHSARADLQLAQAEAKVGRFEHVLRRVASAIAYYDKHGDAGERYFAHISAGKSHLFMRDGERVLHHVAQARKAAGGKRALQDLSLEASALSYLNRLEDAIPIFKETLPLIQDTKPQYRIASLVNLTNVLMHVDRPGEAVPYIADARKLLEHVPDLSLHAHVYAAQALVHSGTKQWDAAIEAATKASEVNEQLLNRELRAANEILLARSWLQKDDTERAMGHASNALKIVLERSATLPARLGAQYRSSVRSAFQIALRAAREADDPPKFFQFAEQAAAVALRNRLGAQEVVNHAFPAALRTREIELQKAETVAVAAYRKAARTRNAKTRSTTLDALGKVREQLDRHRERVRSEVVAAGQVVDPEVDDLAATQARLADDEALLMFVRDARRIYGFRVTKTDARIVDLFGRKEIDPLVDGVVLEDPGTPWVDIVLSLRKAIAEPLNLPPGVKRLIIVPTGRLAHLPYAVIWPGRTVRLASSTTIDRLLQARDPKPGEGVLAVGDPEGADGRRLPGAREEAKAIGDKVLLGAEATEERLEQAIESRARWRAVHIATHALIDPKHPLRSALSLSPADKRDGLWTVSEILQASVKADLVVLGACSTGRGKTFDQEGALGFVQAFFVAGAKRVLVSLWDVDDKATSALLKRFHERWKGGVSPAKALADAQDWLRKQTAWAHPGYWAAWQLWGPE